MDHLKRDVRFALRTMARSPVFTLVTVLTLGLGIGACAAIFSVVDALLLRPLPYDESGSLVTVWLDMTERDGPPREWFTPEDFADYRAQDGLFEELGAWGGWGPTLTGLGDPEVLTAGVVSQGTFEGVLRVQPMLGRGFLPEEDEPGAAGVVVISYGFWQERMGADPDVIGRTIVLDEVAHAVVGVMPEGFQPPFIPRAEVWAPVRLDPTVCGRGCYTIRTVARLAPGVSLDVAEERGGALATRLAETYPATNARVGVSIFPLQEDLVRTAERALWVLLGAVGFVLLIACSNVANLLLARGSTREGEFAVRVALGAARGPILRQLLTESVVLAGIGGLVGLGLATWSTDLLLAVAPVSTPGLERVGIDWRILGFTAALTMGTAILFGLLPALRSSRADVYSGVRGRMGGSRRARGLHGGLVIGQVAMAMVLLIGAGLLIRSFQQLAQADLGFNPEGVLTVNVALPTSRFESGSSRIEYYRALEERLRALPGVVTVSATSSPPLAGNDGDADFRIEGMAPAEPTDPSVAWIRRVTQGYFYTMDQRLLEGRDFEPRDAAGAPPVVVVNETLASRYFDYPRRNPVGERVTFGSGDEPLWRTVVGVARDTRHFGIRDGTRPAMYFPYAQVPTAAMTMIVRTAGDPVELTDDARGAVSEIDARLAASGIAPLTDLVDGALANERFAMRLLGLFAALALVLAAVGLYGVVSYRVTLRMREMGIRLALGAEGDEVRRMVVVGGLGLTGVGVVAGTVAALLMAGALEALLFDVGVADPVTFLAVTGVLSVVALVASWVPARRAARADPVSILRAE